MKTSQSYEMTNSDKIQAIRNLNFPTIIVTCKMDNNVFRVRIAANTRIGDLETEIMRQSGWYSENVPTDISIEYQR